MQWTSFEAGLKNYILHVGGPYIHVEDHTICVPYKVRGPSDHTCRGPYIYVVDHTIPVPHKVRGAIRMYMWEDHTYMWGTTQCVPYKVRRPSDHTCGDHMYMWGNRYKLGDHMIHIPYKVRGDHQMVHVGTTHTCGGTIQYLFNIR